MVGSRAGYDHTERRPMCGAKTFDLIIPVSEGAKMIGRNNE
jgi:hypothetical protein